MIQGTVALVGRPNAGKSTLFNRLIGWRKAIVDPQAGVTRDRIYGTAYYEKNGSQGFTLIDTGGFEGDSNTIWEQTTQAIKQADLVILLLDANCGVHQDDYQILAQLKQTGVNFIACVNKVDGQEHEANAWDFYRLGIEKLQPISAAHNKGIRTLRSEIQSHLAEVKHPPAPAGEGPRLALIGRPNAGKSSLLNKILGSERSIVSSIPGTTRDALDVQINYAGKNYTLVDTAGIRRRSRVKDQLETYSVLRSIQSIERAELIIFVIDADEGLTDQDARLINMATERHKPVLILINKWDLIADKHSNSSRDYELDLKTKQLKDLAFIPVSFISCKTGQRVNQVMARVAEILEQSRKIAKTTKVNQALEMMVNRHSPHLLSSWQRRTKFYYATQVQHSPPTIVIKCNVAKELKESYKRYMCKQFRRELGFEKVPIRLIFRSKQEDRERKAG